MRLTFSNIGHSKDLTIRTLVHKFPNLESTLQQIALELTTEKINRFFLCVVIILDHHLFFKILHHYELSTNDLIMVDGNCSLNIN